MKKVIIFILSFISCTNYHEDISELSLLEIPSFELPLGPFQKDQPLLTQSSNEEGEDPPVEDTLIENELTENEFINISEHWYPGEPTGNQPYIFMISNTGKWVDHDNTLNDDGYGLYQINKLYSEITPQSYSDFNDYTFLGELNGITYFFSKTISSCSSYLSKRPLNGEGKPVILNTEEKINFIVSFHENYSTRAFWIGLRKVNGEWEWVAD